MLSEEIKHIKQFILSLPFTIKTKNYYKTIIEQNILLISTFKDTLNYIKSTIQEHYIK